MHATDTAPAPAVAAQVRLLMDRSLNRLLPLMLDARGRWAKSGYERLLAAYRLDYLRQQRRQPAGVPYRLLRVDDVAPGAKAYCLQAPPGVEHDSEDTLLLRWQNADDEVQAVLDRQRWRGDEPLRLRDGHSAYAPGGWLHSDVRHVLRDLIDLRSLPPIALPGPVSGVGHWPRQRPRSYSVSGVEHRPDGDRVEIVVSEVWTDAGDSPPGGPSSGPAAGAPQRLGRCCGYLARLRPGDELRAWPLAAPLTLQRPQAGAAAPLLVVTTGIAAAGPLGSLPRVPAARPVWLLCGLRRADTEQPFVQRLLAATARPGLRLDMALSRDDAPAVAPPGVAWHARQRVQDVLAGQTEAVAALLAAGGDIVVIGHTSMGDSVRAWLRSLLRQTEGLVDEAAAQAALQRLEAELRVQYSLSGH